MNILTNICYIKQLNPELRSYARNALSNLTTYLINKTVTRDFNCILISNLVLFSRLTNCLPVTLVYELWSW